jgi:glycosyltransferase involved in cell wall biosynthesis
MAADATKRVLFLAYYFPPLGGGGVQRSLKFCKYLPQFGYTPRVVTGPPSASFYWTPEDETLSTELPPATEVHRVPGKAPPRSAGWAARRQRWLRVRDPFGNWWVDGLLKLGHRVGHDVDLIYASMSPFETGEAAAVLAGELGKPWVADLRDPWALDEWLVYPTSLHRRLEMRTMGRTLASANAIVMNTPEATRQLLEHFPRLRSKIVVTIPNGFDSEDFTGPRPINDSGGFTIAHAGFLHTAVGLKHRRERSRRSILGGAVRGLEILPRSHVFLVAAVEQLLVARPDLSGHVEILLAGIFSESDRAALNSDIVVPLGYLPHKEVIALLRSADLLFLPMHDLPKGKRSRIVPGKTYEYLASETPILAAVPDGDARDLLEEAQNAKLCRPSDVSCLATAIEREIESRRRGELPARPNAAVVARFERRRLTEELARVFAQVESS